MGRRIRITTAAGDVFDEDEDQAFQTMNDLDAMGMKFEANDGPAPAGAAGVFSAPEGIEPVQDEPPDWIRGLVSQGNRMEQGQQLTREGMPGVVGGMVRGATAHAWDPLQQQREAMPRDVQLASDAAGGLVSPLNLVGGGAAGAVAANALQGGIRGYNDADPSLSTGDRALAGLESGAWDAALGAGVSGLAGAGGKLLKGGAEGAQTLADKSRLKSWRVEPDALKAFADKLGASAYADAIGRGVSPAAARDLELAASNSDYARRQMVGAGERMVPPNAIAARGPGEWEQGFGEKKNELDRAINGLIGQAEQRGAQLPPDPRGMVAGGLDQAALDAASSGAGARMAGPLEQNAGFVRAGPQSQSPFDVRSQKAAWDAQAFKGAPGTPEDLAGKANYATANGYRDMLRDFIGQGGPDLSQQFSGANQDFGVASDIYGASRDAGMRASTAGGPNLGQNASGNGVLNRIAGAMLPGPDTQANLMRGAERGLGAAAGGAQFAAEQAPNVTSAGRRAILERNQQSEAFKQEGANDDTVGPNLSKNILRTLETNRAALGPYADRFGALSDPEELAVLAQRLYQTDPRFAKTVWPVLNRGR